MVPLKKKRKVVLNFPNGRFVIPSSDEQDFTRDEGIRDKVIFANDMIREQARSRSKSRRRRSRR